MVSKFAQTVMDSLGGQRYINMAMPNKFLTQGDNSFGIRLKRKNLNKIDHIEITGNGNQYDLKFWAMGKPFDMGEVVASHLVDLHEIRTVIERETTFTFMLGDPLVNEEIAETALEIFGGLQRLKRLTNVQVYQVIDRGFRAKLGVKGSRGVNMIELTLNGNDFYNINLISATDTKRILIEELKNIFVGDVPTILREKTGIAFSMPKVDFA